MKTDRSLKSEKMDVPVTEGAGSFSAAESEGSGSGAGLIVVSNREPYEHVMRKAHALCERTDGGLTSVLDPVLKRVGGVWVAWGSGDADRSVVGSDGRIAVPPE